MALVVWTTPRTYTLDEVVTQVILNDDLRDNMLALPHPYDYDMTNVPATNTAAETTIYSKTITGGDMGTNGCFELLMSGIVLHNTTDTIVWRFKFGGTTWLQSSTGQLLPTDADTVPWEVRCTVANRAATNLQVMTATHVLWNATLEQATTGYGNFAYAGSPLGGLMHSHNLTVDTTTNQTFAITVQWGAASASNAFEKHLARLLLGKN